MAARTAAPADPVAAPVSPARDPAGPPSPVLAWPSEWPVPVLPEPASRARRRAERGLPMAPTLAAAGNATSLLATGAYEAGGVVGLAATGVVAAAGATAAVVRRRATVRRNMAARQNNRGATNWPRSGGSGLLSGGRSSGGNRGGLGSSSGNSGHRAPNRSGAGASGLFGGGTLRQAPRPGGKNRPDAGAGTGSLDLTRTPKKDRSKKKHKNHGLAAALGRTARASAKPDSKPRKALAAVGHGTVAATKAAGRGVKKAWIADKTRQARKSVRAGAKTLRGAATDGLRATLAAAWTGLRKRSGRAALNRLRETWGRRRKHRADKTAAAAEEAASSKTPEVATTVRRPTATTTAPTSGGPAVSGGHHFVAPAMEMARIAASYEPTSMLQVGADFAGLEEALRLTAEAMKISVENADAKQPLADPIIEIMRGIHSLQLKAAELATELGPAFEKLHAVDLERLRNPRKGAAGERMWDVTTNLL